MSFPSSHANLIIVSYWSVARVLCRTHFTRGDRSYSREAYTGTVQYSTALPHLSKWWPRHARARDDTLELPPFQMTTHSKGATCSVLDVSTDSDDTSKADWLFVVITIRSSLKHTYILASASYISSIMMTRLSFLAALLLVASVQSFTSTFQNIFC